jgi:flagellum-specific ATP synthase
VTTALIDLPTRLRARLGQLAIPAAPQVRGRVVGVRGLAVTIQGLAVRVGDVVTVGSGPSAVACEVVSVEAGTAACLPLGAVTGIGAGDPVVSTGGALEIAVGPELLGRVLDGLGRPLDGRPLPALLDRVSTEMDPPSPLLRRGVNRPLATGVRAIDAFTPFGRGQRVGIFAGSGVGKSSLLSMITKRSEAQLTVVALIGERGREVKEFLDDSLGAEGLRNAIVVVATSDQPPMVRLRAAFVATRIAEWFRDAGNDVLLMMDSITRLAMAQREVGLAVGEPPATRGYPPSVFAMMPRLLERSGGGEHGSITGIYTVLVEGDDHSEPIADTARSILDGHIVLDRKLATNGHFPSIEVLESVSRVTGAVTTSEEQAIARTARRLLSARRDVKELVEIGAYVAGTNPEADRALGLWPHLEAFLQQGLDEPSGPVWARLGELVGIGRRAEAGSDEPSGAVIA